MTLDQLHRKAAYYGSAVGCAMVLALATSPNWQWQPAHYVFRQVGDKTCLVDSNSGTFAPTPDGMPICSVR